MTSSVDPRLEMVAIGNRLRALTAPYYEGIAQGTNLAVDGFGNVVPYRDFQPGSVVPAAQQRLLAAPEQSQPYVWAFQITHVAPTRLAAIALSIETDRALIGWGPTTSASQITSFYFTTYDEFSRSGERVEWLATRFYQTTLGQSPDMVDTTVLF